MQWILVDRRSGGDDQAPISIAGLRQDLHDAADAFLALLGYAELFVEEAPWPQNFEGGHYLGRPTA